MGYCALKYSDYRTRASTQAPFWTASTREASTASPFEREKLMKKHCYQKSASSTSKYNRSTVCLDDMEIQDYPLSKRNRKEAQTRRWKAQQERARKMKRSDESQKLHAFLNNWLSRRKATLDADIYDAYRNCLNRYIVPALGRIGLQQITDEQLQRYCE